MATAVFGAVLVAVGLLMIRSHRRAWARQQGEAGLSREDRTRLFLRYRRRLQMSGMIAVLGVMLGVGDALIWDQGLLVATVYWVVVIGLGVWLLLLGIADLASVRIGSRDARDELRQISEKRKELEAELEEMQRRRSNGEARSNGQH
ncbi:MAG: hypothetical protein VYA32_11185 [Planctomycetota bacterium]|nr:hypothetical protein [Planctomycetota bacterium]MED5400423.1 hypothetical protein [Planctomycetota bacterium]